MSTPNAGAPEVSRDAHAVGPDLLDVELDAPFLSVEPGGAPVSLTLRIANRSSIVERFTVHVAGLDSEWFVLSSSVVALFPGDTEQIELRIVPPLRRPDLRAGAYPFQVSVRSAGGGATSSPTWTQLWPTNSATCLSTAASPARSST